VDARAVTDVSENPAVSICRDTRDSHLAVAVLCTKISRLGPVQSGHSHLAVAVLCKKISRLGPVQSGHFLDITGVKIIAGL
jgi:hypothetical protein